VAKFEVEWKEQNLLKEAKDMIADFFGRLRTEKAEKV